MPHAAFSTEFALSVRHEIARRASVEPEAVHATDRLPEEWGDLFFRADPDAVEFIMNLEEQFGVAIPDRTAMVFCRESISVADLAAELARGAVAGRQPWWRWW